MTYTPKDQANLSSERTKLLGKLENLMAECNRQGGAVSNARAKEYMRYGAARRVLVLRRSLENIFDVFPPSRARPLAQEELSDVQINLHAFMINLYGVWDNWAWAFVHRHDLESQIGDYKNVGLFNRKTQKFLPSELRDYLKSDSISKWQKKYLKNYRDALAHRIPLYVPPAIFTPKEKKQYNRLEEEQFECIKSMRWERLEETRVEQANIGKPCFAFLHSFSKEEAPDLLALHAQVISDCMTVVEFGTMFVGAWHERAYPPVPVKNWWRLRISRVFRALSGKLAQWEKVVGGKSN